MADQIRASLVLRGAINNSPFPGIEAGLRLRGRIVQPFTSLRKRVVLTDMDGVPAENGFLADATVGPITTAPCKPGQCTFRMAASDPKLSGVLAEKFQEAQIWVGSRIVLWGPITGYRFDGGSYEFTVKGASEYPTRRTVGPARRRSLLGDGMWTTGYEGWTPVVTGPSQTWSAPDANAYSEITSHPELWNTNALHLHDATSNPPEDERMPVVFKDYLLVPGGFEREVRLKARYWVSTFTEPNHRQTGLVLMRCPMSWLSIWDDPIEVVTDSVRIDENHPTGKTVDHQVSLIVPPATPAYIRAQIEGPIGDCYVWDVWFEYDEGLEFNGEDQADIFFKTVDHLTANPSSPYTFALTHPNYPWETSGYDKSNVKIDVETSHTGRTRSRQYMFHEHRRGESCMSDFADLVDGIEWGERFTATSRTIYTQHPKLGHYRADCTLRWSPAGGNILAAAYTFEGDQGANSITVLAPSDGWRNGSALDTTAFANGLTLDDTIQAPVDASRDDLDSIAQRRLDQALNPVTLSVTIAADPYWTDRALAAGDRVSVYLAPAGVELEAGTTWWIRSMTLDEDNRLHLEMVPWTGNLL